MLRTQWDEHDGALKTEGLSEDQRHLAVVRESSTRIPPVEPACQHAMRSDRRSGAGLKKVSPTILEEFVGGQSPPQLCLGWSRNLPRAGRDGIGETPIIVATCSASTVPTNSARPVDLARATG